MEKKPVAVIGPGRVGSALGKRLGTAGWPILYGVRSPEKPEYRDLLAASGAAASLVSPAEAAQRAEIIIFAIPWRSAKAAITSLGSLAGKILIDTTNPLRYEGGVEFEVDVPHSAAELIQDWAPDALVVKGFNTTNSRILANPSLVDGPITIALAGNDKAAKDRVAELVTDAGFHPVDSGPLFNAHYIEKMAVFYLSFLFQDRPDAIEYYLRPRPNNQFLEQK